MKTITSVYFSVVIRDLYLLDGTNAESWYTTTYEGARIF
jgi:hypothetical protein